MWSSPESFQGTGLGTCSCSPRAHSLVLRALLPPRHPALAWTALAYRAASASPTCKRWTGRLGVSHPIQVTRGRWGRGEQHPSPLAQGAAQRWISHRLSAGNQGGEGAGTCLGREVALGMQREPREAALCSGDFCWTYQWQWDRRGVCVQVSPSTVVPTNPSDLVPRTEGAAAGVRLGFCCDGACPVSHPDVWMQLFARDSLQQLKDPRWSSSKGGMRRRVEVSPLDSFHPAEQTGPTVLWPRFGSRKICKKDLFFQICLEVTSRF